MRIRIRKRWWKLLRGRMSHEDDGQCYPASREIIIRSNLRGERELDVLIHELLHASYGDLDEGAVEEAASDIARVLWREGYRKHEAK